jgi:hypothetical protein
METPFSTFVTAFLPEKYGAVGDGVTDDYTALTACIAACPNGGRVYLSRTYATSQKISINKPITVSGTWGRLFSSTSYGSGIVPTSAGAQVAMGTLVEVSGSYARLEGVRVSGLTGTTADGTIGIRFVGTSGTHCHAAKLVNCYVEYFGTGISLGAYSDHISTHQSEITNNYDGVLIEVNNQFDYAFIDTLMTGNAHASVFLTLNTTVENLLFLRSHLGFGQYGILQDSASTSGGIAQLDLIASPIESVSQQFINICKGGGIRVRGGYWVWSGTPAKTAITVGQLVYGAIDIGYCDELRQRERQ